MSINAQNLGVIMTPTIIYDAVKFWLPIVTGTGIIIKAYLTAKKNASEWLERIMNRQLGHLEVSTEHAAKAVVELAGFHKDMLESQKEMVRSQGDVLGVIKDMHADFQHHVSEDVRVQSQILTGIEILKAKS